MPAEAKKSFLLRADPELWRELEAWAAAELRSVNGQVEYILRDAVRRHQRAAPPPGDTPGPPQPPAAEPAA